MLNNSLINYLFLWLVMPPIWSSSYSVEGDIYVPFAEVVEPFEAWYDSDSSNSRIDYYNGNVLYIILDVKNFFYILYF